MILILYFFLLENLQLNIFVTFVELNFVDVFLDALLFAAWAYHKNIIGVDHNVILQAVDNGNFLVRDRNYCVTSAVCVTTIT